MQLKWLLLLGTINITFAISVSPEQFFFQTGYEKGYKEGYERGYKEGYKQAVKDFELILKAYREDIKALEEGKYLVREGYITAPRLYRVQNPDGTISFKVVGCRIEKLRNLENIIKNPFSIPIITPQKVEKVKEASERLITIPQLPVSKPNFKRVQVYIIPLKGNNKELLNRLGIPYEIEPQTGKIKAIFFSKEDVETFCKKYQICQ